MYLSPVAAADFDAVESAAAGARARGQRLLVGPEMSGWYAMQHQAPLDRHTWYLRGVIRPWEEARVADAFATAAAVVVCWPIVERTSRLTDMKWPATVEARVVREFPRETLTGGNCIMRSRQTPFP